MRPDIIDVDEPEEIERERQRMAEHNHAVLAPRDWEYPVMFDYDDGLKDWQVTAYLVVAYRHGAHRAEVYVTQPDHYNVVCYFKRVVPRDEVVRMLEAAGCDRGYIELVRRKGVGMRLTPRTEMRDGERRVVPVRKLILEFSMADFQRAVDEIAKSIAISTILTGGD
jgi:hypothetical protein